MKASWPQLFHDLDPQSQLVVRACAVLDHFSLSQVAAAAVLEVSRSQAATAQAALAAAGWGEVVDDRLATASGARSFLQRLLHLTPRDEVRAVVEKTAAAVEHAMAGRAPISPGVRGDVLGVLRAANRVDAADVATRVAHAAWDMIVPGTISPGSDLVWWRAVAEEGEQAASRSRQPRLLVELLDRSAQAYSAAGDWRAAEAAWTRALYLVDRLGDSAEFTRHLELLAENYHEASQATALAETLVELVERYEHDDKPALAASALARLGATMLDADQPDSAILYLRRSDQLLQEIPQTRELRVRHALILSDLGRAHARRHAVNSARTSYHAALGLVVDVDEGVAQRIRDLQAELQDSPT